jgi:hypothetical protein
MAIEDISAAAPDKVAPVPGGAAALRALVVGYVDVFETVDRAPLLLWVTPERPRILRWLRFPAHRAVVRILIVRHVSRSVGALQRYAARRVAVADDAREPLIDLNRVETFEKSLPAGPPLIVIRTLVAFGVLDGMGGWGLAHM